MMNGRPCQLCLVFRVNGFLIEEFSSMNHVWFNFKHFKHPEVIDITLKFSANYLNNSSN